MKKSRENEAIGRMVARFPYDQVQRQMRRSKLDWWSASGGGRRFPGIKRIRRFVVEQIQNVVGNSTTSITGGFVVSFNGRKLTVTFNGAGKTLRVVEIIKAK